MHLIDQQLNLLLRGKREEGWKISEKIKQEFPDDIRGKFNRGWLLISRGDFQEGFQHLEYGRFLNVYGNERLNTNKPIWDQSDLSGKTVILNLEAGYGDQIIFARFANEIAKRGGICIICCEDSMHSLFLRVPGVTKCITLREVSVTYHDFWIPSFSCSWLFGHTVENIPNDPYIFAKKESVSLWSNLIDSKKLKVGIRWSGNPQFEHQQFRIFPPKYLINLHKQFPECQFYSLQKDNDTIELPEKIIDMQHLIISWEDTAACIENLDLVITSCTSVAHLASAMGKPTWVIVPILPYYIWAYGDKHSPWYKETTRVFRQKTFGKWNEPFDEIKTELSNMISRNINISDSTQTLTT